MTITELSPMTAQSATSSGTSRQGTLLRSELYKLLHHRTPWVTLGVLTTLMVVGPIYYLFRAPGLAEDYVALPIGVSSAAVGLILPIFGAWVLGHEYRHATLKRVIALEGRRDGVLFTKGLIALVGGVIGIAVSLAVAIAVAAAAARIHGDSLVFTGSGRQVLSTIFVGAVVTGLAYLASAIMRSDTYAILGTIGLMSTFGQLLALVPRVAEFFPPVAMSNLSIWISDPASEFTNGALWKGAVSLGVTFVVAAIAARQLFTTRDL